MFSHNEGVDLVNSRTYAKGDKPDYAFCESVHATGTSPWHIRKVGPEGLKCAGGIGNNSLCDRVKAPYGWDLEVKISEEYLKSVNICKGCFEKFREAVPSVLA